MSELYFITENIHPPMVSKNALNAVKVIIDENSWEASSVIISVTW